MSRKKGRKDEPGVLDSSSVLFARRPRGGVAVASSCLLSNSYKARKTCTTRLEANKREGASLLGGKRGTATVCVYIRERGEIMYKTNNKVARALPC